MSRNYLKKGIAYAPAYFIAFSRKIDIGICSGIGDPDRWGGDIDRNGNHRL
jgi:hypothetical protein